MNYGLSLAAKSGAASLFRFWQSELISEVGIEPTYRTFKLSF